MRLEQMYLQGMGEY